MANPLDWTPLYDRFYKKSTIYDMRWKSMLLAAHRVAIAPFGGPIALVRDDDAVHTLSLTGEHGDAAELDALVPHELRIFNCAGVLLSSLPWQFTDLVAMKWNCLEQLVCVLRDGSVFLYNVHGERVSSLQLPSACTQDGIAECLIWEDGLVVRTATSYELHAILNFRDPHPVRLPDAGLMAAPTSMCVLHSARADPHDASSAVTFELALATSDGSLIVVDAKQAQDQQLNAGPFVLMSVSPSGALIACFSADGTLHVMSTDFTKNISKFGTSSRVPPTAMEWCGEEAVVLHWDGLVLVVGMFGDFVKYSYDGALVLFAEMDGVRVLTDTTLDLLQRVSESSESVFKAGSTSSAAKLYAAQGAYEEKDGSAVEFLRDIEEEEARERAAGSTSTSSKVGLKAAIEACLAAAAFEWTPTTQQSLLKAASYGKLFCPTFSADRFVDMCRNLRVLTAVRHPSVGMPLTYNQFMKIGAECLVDRLVQRHLHLLAVRICQFLNMEIDKVLVHWACTKIVMSGDDMADSGGNALSDEKLGELIIAKLKMCPGISYAPIATAAFRNGRRTLAKMLLEFETLAADQVPLLLSMKEDELALEKAIQSGDTDLVYMCLLHMRKTRQMRDFVALIRDKALARNLYITYCKQTDLAALKQFYYALQNPVEAANVAVMEAYQCETFNDRMQRLEVARDFYEKDKTSAFMAKATEDQIKLLQAQKEYDLAQVQSSTDAVETSLDLSVSEMLELHITQNDRKRAQKLQSTFKVSDARMWHLDVRALAKAGLWDELYKLVVNYKKVPPIGYVPFIEACVEAKEYAEAVKYIERLPDARAQIEWLCNINYWKEAGDVAFKARDGEALKVIRERCRNPAAVQHLDKLLTMHGSE